MTQEELKEKRERFRLYGEICLLMEEQDEDIFDLVTVSRCDMPLEHEIVVRMEDGDSGDFRGIQFEDGMIYNGHGDPIGVRDYNMSESKEILTDGHGNPIGYRF